MIESIHNVTPITLSAMPAIGNRGMKGHNIISIMLRIPPSNIIILPVTSRMSLETNPIQRDISLSRNIRNLRSMEDELDADSADI